MSKVSCSQCGCGFAIAGRDVGFSHCENHTKLEGESVKVLIVREGAPILESLMKFKEYDEKATPVMALMYACKEYMLSEGANKDEMSRLFRMVLNDYSLREDPNHV